MSRPRWVTIAPILLLLWPSGSHSKPQPETVAVRLNEKIDNNITRSTYSLTVASGHAELIVDRDLRTAPKPELRFTVWKGERMTFSEDTSIPIDQRLSHFRTLMASFLKTEPESASYGLLFYGYSNLYQRLPVLAARDSEWDRRSGRPRSGEDSYRYLQNLLNKADAYGELSAAINQLHYRVRIEGGMENLRVLPVSMLSREQRKNLPAGLRESDLLPARVSIDFLLTRE
jgi:hypothetical protein